MSDIKKKRRVRLWLYFSGVIFSTISVLSLSLLVLWIVFYYLGVARLNPFDYHMPIVSMLLFSMFIGGGVSFTIGRIIIRPIRDLGDAFEELSRGNFDVKMPINGKLADVREISERFNDMAHDLANVETLRGDFVSNVSHEFKTPIAAIEGYATLLQNPNLTREKHDNYIEKILTNTKRLTDLTSNILALSKLENQETILHISEYRLDEQLRRAVLLLEDKWTDKNIDLDIDLPEQLFSGDEKLLDQVWFNLIDNAIKHSHVGGTIRLSITPSDDTVSVTVKDNGDGMSEDTQKHIFEKFYQGDSSHRSEGNGLGLAIVKRIVDICHGEISVKSEVGNGAAFTVTLPCQSE